ncbi:hypothetical protein LOY64_04410 [Pseudomonas corrugata]|uniref:hypothetical protein n=1 Tax=Pseudomonas corrugata TaxID=47879 RepID=UPI00222F17FC|nr:hypothetical protein [Pseudomonas corrugata]UZD96256.1 hypothetical protein LOY64_04410 [Pseudomonas corrugata]
MLTSDVEQRAINLTDAAARAHENGLTGLSEKLQAQAMTLLSAGEGKSFEGFAKERGLNMERVHGRQDHFASKHTQELFECWLEARGQEVCRAPVDQRRGLGGA